MTDFSVVRQPQAHSSCITFRFYRCLPASGPYALHRFRILRVSHTSGMMSAFLPLLYEKSLKNAIGLIPKNWLYVHLSGDQETAMKVGKRHGDPVVYRVAAGAMARDGHKFWRSANGVWLVKCVPPEYLEKQQ